MNENTILKAAQLGDQEALNQLILHYEPEIRKIACKYFLQRADYEDLLQEGRIAVYKAILSYNDKENIPFLHFVRLVIKRKLIDSLRAHNRQKHSNHNEASTYNMNIIDEQEKKGFHFMADRNDPAATVTAHDEACRIIKSIISRLSPMEQQVLYYYLFAGMNQREVSERLGLSAKSLDNAIQRIRKKSMLYRSKQTAV